MKVLLELGPEGRANLKETEADEVSGVATKLKAFVRSRAQGLSWSTLQVFHNVPEELLNGRRFRLLGMCGCWL